MPNNDFILPISFNNAQDIGLEESVLLAYFEQHAFVLCDRNLNFDVSSLSTQLSFWSRPEFLRILASLQLCQALQFERNGNMLSIYLPNINDSSMNTSEVTLAEKKQNSSVLSDNMAADNLLIDKVSRLQQQARGQKTLDNGPKSTHSTENSSIVTTHKSAAAYQPPSTDRAESWPRLSESHSDSRRGVTDFDLYLEQKERTRQPDQWQPEEATLEQISQAGIDRPFALQLQSEFLLRIKEQRKNVRTWNSEFFKYVKRQWQYKQSDRSSYEGTQGSSYNSRTSKEQVSDALTNIHDTDW